MKKNTLFCIYSIVASLVMSVQGINAQHHEQKHGKVEFEMSCSPESREIFETGLALLHHMMYEQAERLFKAATETDPDCAMAYWGIAMTVIHPLWGERPSDRELEKGREAIDKATLLNPPTERERAYIAALEMFFSNWKNTSYGDQLLFFEEGFKEVHEAFPDDINAAAFYALGHLATAPKEDKTFTHQKRAGMLLEELHKHAPEHPGLFHYIIHSYDNRVLAERAVNVAMEYDKIAPDVPHALHMPSHIFVRQGLWPEVIDWNTRSAEAALRQPVNNSTSMHYAHALDYLVYAYLQRGDDKKAKKVLKKMNEVDDLQQNFGAAYAVAAVQARYALEREKWEEAAMIPITPVNLFPLEKYPSAESIIYYARGIGAARTGNLVAARRAMDSLDGLHDKLIELNETYWAVLTDAQRTAIAAWIAFSEGENEMALSLMQKAADMEDSVDKHPVSPGHVLPARELFGDMLLELDRPAEAIKAYEASLELSANRFRSIHGIAQAAELTNNMELALFTYGQLVGLSAEDAESERPQLVQAKKIVDSHRQ